MAAELKNNEDFRVRTQAALALGATKDTRALGPLCMGLEDSNTTVRAAAAAAMGKLALGGFDCLKNHLESETNASVKSVIQKAMDSVKVGQRPSVTAATKYYIAVGPTTDKSGRTGVEVDDMVHAAMEGASSALDGYVVAPRNEQMADAKATIGRFKQLRPFFLWPKVMPPDYTGGRLTVRFEVSVFTYPGKAMKGTIPLKLTMPDVSSIDKASENDLIKQAAESAFKKFADNAERFLE
jgi:HEAT repeats